ncbi:MAG: alpha amylase C-terminal domain-containing protein, partial [Christensenella sp.]
KKQLDWFLLEYDSHAGMKRFVKALNHVYTAHPALYETDDGWDGFKWLNVEDAEKSTLAFMRIGGDEMIVCAMNFTPVVQQDYWVAMPEEGTLKLLISGDEKKYGGAGTVLENIIHTQHKGMNGMEHSAIMTIPALGAVYYKFTLKSKGDGEK